MDCIVKLQKLGYQLTVTDDKIAYKFIGSETPDAAVVKPLLVELKSRKQEALNYLRPYLWQVHGYPASRTEAEWRKLMRKSQKRLQQVVYDRQAASKAFADACYANACLKWLKKPTPEYKWIWQKMRYPGKETGA